MERVWIEEEVSGRVCGAELLAGDIEEDSIESLLQKK